MSPSNDSGSGSHQKQLVEGKATAGGTVWVVAAKMMDNPHPEVLGVYDNEAAAEEHEKEIKRNNGMWDGWPVSSFWTYEMEIQSEVDSE